MSFLPSHAFPRENIQESGGVRFRGVSVLICFITAPDPVYKFTKNLPKKADVYTLKEMVLECTCNSSKAQVQWYKNDLKINASERFQIEQDSHGKKILRVFNLNLEDGGEYSCKIVHTTEKTQCKVSVTEQKFQFMKMLKSIIIPEKEPVTLECEVDEWEAPVQWFKDGKEIKGDKQ